MGLLNRNIKISSGADANGWGYRVLIYGYLELPTGEGPPTPRNGYVKLIGVELADGGQYDTTFGNLRLERLGYYTATEMTS